MRPTISRIGLAGIAGVVLLAFAVPVEARIQCKGIYQVSKYGLIATPYCGDQQIAAVAQSYGVRVTANQVRNDPLIKVKLCFRFGGDTRLKGACGAYAPEQYR
jgi:hypothetical protein